MYAKAYTSREPPFKHTHILCMVCDVPLFRSSPSLGEVQYIYTDYLALHSVKSCLLSLNISTNSEFVATHSHHFMDYNLWLIRPPNILFYINIIIVQYTVYTLWLFESCPTASWNCSLSFLLCSFSLASLCSFSLVSNCSFSLVSNCSFSLVSNCRLWWPPWSWLSTTDAASTTGFLGTPEWDSDTFKTSWLQCHLCEPPVAL